MPIYEVKTELRYPELLALLRFSQKIRTLQREEELWQAMVETASMFYDNIGLFIPIDDHRLRYAIGAYRNEQVHRKFEELGPAIIIDAGVTPHSLVATCFRTRATTYISELTDEETAQQNRMVIELLQPTDGLNVPIMAGEQVRVVMGCINTRSGSDSLANVAMMEVLAHLSSNWYEMYARSLQFALTEQTWKDTTLQILHEAFNSLNQSIWSTRLLGRNSDDMTEPQVGYLQVVENNQQLLRRLLNELADFCRLDRGAIPLQMNRYPPEKLLVVVEEIIKGLAPEARARVSIQEQVNQPFDIMVDLDRFRQIATNLISNAVKYSEGAITVGVNCSHPIFAVTVADQGPGIPAEEQPKIFDPYYRIKNKAPSDPSGWGLGLYITKRLIELHKGELEVQSSLAKGSAFTVKFFDVPRAA